MLYVTEAASFLLTSLGNLTDHLDIVQAFLAEAKQWSRRVDFAVSLITAHLSCCFSFVILSITLFFHVDYPKWQTATLAHLEWLKARLFCLAPLSSPSNTLARTHTHSLHCTTKSVSCEMCDICQTNIRPSACSVKWLMLTHLSETVIPLFLLLISTCCIQQAI